MNVIRMFRTQSSSLRLLSNSVLHRWNENPSNTYGYNDSHACFSKAQGLVGHGNHLQFEISADRSYCTAIETSKKIVYTRDEQLPRVGVSSSGDVLTVDLGNQTHSFFSTWLRKNCHCADCFMPLSLQWKIDPTELEPVYTITDVYIKDENVIVSFHDGHVTTIPLTYLEENSKAMLAEEDASQNPKLKNISNNSLSTLKYADVNRDDEGLRRWVSSLHLEGRCLVEGVPENVKIEFMEKIWPLQATIFGKAVPLALVIKPDGFIEEYASTSSKMAVHTDLPYYESPPGYQFLFCKRFDDAIVGGDSILVDALFEAERMQTMYPEDFEALSTFPVTTKKVQPGYSSGIAVSMEHSVPHFDVDRNGSIRIIRWCPLSDSPITLPIDDQRRYYKAYQRYAQMLDTSETKVVHRLRAGDLLAFDNHRMVHGRNAITLNGGTRHLHTLYMERDGLRNKYNVLSQI